MCDIRARPAQNLRVLELDIRDDRDLPVHDVGGIQATAQAHLDHSPFKAAVAEDHEGGRSQEIEPARPGCGRSFATCCLVSIKGEREGISKHALIDVATKHADPLCHAFHVGRRISPYAKSSAEKARLNQRADGALSFCACDMNGSEAHVRIVESIHEVAHGSKVHAHFVTRPLLPVCHAIEPVKNLRQRRYRR